MKAIEQIFPEGIKDIYFYEVVVRYEPVFRVGRNEVGPNPL